MKAGGKTVAAAVLAISICGGPAFAYDESTTSAKVLRVWVDREIRNQFSSAGRVFVRFNKGVCSAPTGTGQSLAGLDINETNSPAVDMLLRVALAAKLSGKEVNLRTNDENDGGGFDYSSQNSSDKTVSADNIGCHLVRLTID